MPRTSSTPSLAELVAAMRSEEEFAALLKTYELTEDDVLAQVRAFSRRIETAIESRRGSH